MTCLFAGAAAALLLVAAAPVYAADAKIEAALKTFSAVEADAAKLKTFCQMSKAMASATDDEKDAAKSEALDKEITGYMSTLGEDFQKAWDLGADTNPESEDGKAMLAAIEKLEGRCDK